MRDLSLYSQLSSVMRRDPAGRGLATAVRLAEIGAAKALESAAKSLASEGHSVGIVTGFPVHVGSEVAAETDGPPGAIMLASVLRTLGREVRIITDQMGTPALRAACKACSLPTGILTEYPTANGDRAKHPRPTSALQGESLEGHWANEYLAGGHGPGPTHLVAIERPGPTHSLASVAAQRRAGTPPIERFEAALPSELRDRALNMRGEPIDTYIAPTHLLFELATNKHSHIRTIGIGDGGNEIGMGSIAWEMLDDALGGHGAGRIACRIATDDLILAGVSNWGGYALAAAVSHAAGRPDAFAACTVERERAVLESLVSVASCVDGVTRRCEMTVDGLPLDVQLEVLAQIRGLLGLPA